jgi:sugar lactone lactonase YvrE
LSVTPDGVVSVAADDLWFPNGAVISPDGRTLLIAESFGAKISAFTIDAAGALSDRRVFANLDGLYPDGMCLDAEGSLWVACAGGHRVIRVTAGGEIAETISLPGRHAYACMLGGEDRRNLYICTSQDHFPDRTVKLRSGRIEVVRVDTPASC